MLTEVMETPPNLDFFNHRKKLNFPIKSYFFPERQHKHIKAKKSGKAQKCRCGIRVALTALPMPRLREGAEGFATHKTTCEGVWLHRKHLKVRTASGTGWRINLTQVHGREN